MKMKVLALFAMSLAIVGCQHGRGVHSVPADRDYQALEEVCVDDAAMTVNKMHRVGAHRFAPYYAESAMQYMAYALDARAEGDRKGTRDYAGLAKSYAEKAMELGSGIPDGGELLMPDNRDATWAEWKRLKARYDELDQCKAILVAPVVYAHLEANMAQAEHELIERHHHPQAARHLRVVEPDIDAIWAMDSDNDGVRDMDDGEPWIPEDKDGFQDGDGIPEPKPYPILEDTNFATDSSALSAEDKGYLRGIADMLIDGYSEATVVITAHTDTTASEEYNVALSERRENAVKLYLQQCGAQQSMITSSHHGETQPKGDAHPPNRRVEISLDSADPVSPYCN